MPAIETVRLRKYYGKSRGVEDVSLRVDKGEIFGFIGPNGAGKSTTIRVLLNFIFPTSGQARVLGLDAVTDTVAIRRQVGYLPAEVGYYDDMTVRSLLDYSASFYGLDRAAARRRIGDLADAFELDLRRTAHALSAGNRRKVGIVLALLHQPKLLILDEPTISLDPLLPQTRLFEVLAQENGRGTTVFFSSHVLSEVQRFCHRVGIIKDGQLVKVEDVQTLRSGQFQKVKVEFSGTAPAALALPGIIHQRQTERSLEMLYKGDINPLVHLLAQHELVHLSVEEPDLEEVFMHYYQTGGESR